MKKDNRYILLFSIIGFILIVLVSDTMLLIKLLLITFAVLFLFPHVWKVLAIDRMRKIRAALYTALLFTGGLFIYGFTESLITDQFIENTFFDGFLIVLIFSSLGCFLYGLPVSVLAERVSTKYSNYRFMISAVIHIGFGAAALFLVQGLGFYALICSILFFAFDEILRRRT